MDVCEQWVRFVIAASRVGSSFSALCLEFWISRPTGYLWLERYRSGGVASIAEVSRRPLSSPTRTAERIEQRIVALRGERPDWGARKLAVLLEREGILLPAATVHRILLRHGLVRVEDQHRQALKRFEREQPNQLWQMDFKSPKGWDKPLGPLAVIDDATRHAIALDGTWTTRAEAVQERLTAAFIDCGLPDAMLMDHGTPWWNTKAAAG
jgi:transposase InsO family protein